MSADLDNIVVSLEKLKSDLQSFLNNEGSLNIEKNIFSRLLSWSTEIKEKVSQSEIKTNYLLQLNQNIQEVNNHLICYIYNSQHYTDSTDIMFCTLENSINSLIDYSLFLMKLNFFKDNIVAIGANGSGKTALANHLRHCFQNNGVVVSAQRVLKIIDFQAIGQVAITSATLSQNQKQDKTYKTEESFHHLYDEFTIVLQNLISTNIASNYKFRMSYKDAEANSDTLPTSQDSALLNTFSIWNSLIEHRKIGSEDGMSIIVRKTAEDFYQANQMSDGEKVILYLIAQIIQAPKDGFIIIDEPEMHLNKAILKKLWDRLEKEREDCIFIYLTHDLDFAVSRVASKKIWIKEYTPPKDWVIEDIPNEVFPEALMMELLGSRKDILFCESEKGCIDEEVYSILFPKYTIMPVGSCKNVINYVRAYNQLPRVYTKACGVIDSDFRETEEIEKLKKDGIYTIEVSEIENLLLDERFLNDFKNHLLKGDIDINIIKNNILDKFSNDTELQVSNYISSKINYLFSSSHMKRGNTIQKVKSNYTDFTSKVEIDKWYTERKAIVANICKLKDYKKALLLYNNKGLVSTPNYDLSMSDYKDRAIKYLRQTETAQCYLRDYFPDELN